MSKDQVKVDWENRMRAKLIDRQATQLADMRKVVVKARAMLREAKDRYKEGDNLERICLSVIVDALDLLEGIDTGEETRPPAGGNKPT